MLKISACLLPLAFMLFSCQSKNSNTGSIEKKDSAVTAATPATKSKRAILLSNIKTHCFSDSIKKDTFKVVLTGDSLMTARGIFSITSYKGEMIYADTFKGSALNMNVDGDMPISDAKMLANIKKSVKAFFTDSAFSNPPTFADDGNETGEWDQLKGDRTAIGFEVIMDFTDFRIAYCKNTHKVLMYWNDAEAGD